MDAALPLLVASTAAYAVGADAQTVGADREDRPARPHLTREYDGPAGDVLRRRRHAHHPDRARPGAAATGPSAHSRCHHPATGPDSEFPAAVPVGDEIPDPEADGVALRQRLFPVVGPAGALQGILSRQQLERATLTPGPATVAELMNPTPVVVGPHDTLRVVRARFATFGITAAPVVEQAPTPECAARLIGLITVEHLLDGRLPDLAEEHHRTECSELGHATTNRRTTNLTPTRPKTRRSTTNGRGLPYPTPTRDATTMWTAGGASARS